jgi:2,3-bisphosphoglycerate-dependent phosphoglycerate mutase
MHGTLLLLTRSSSGWCDPPLTERGMSQATAAGRLLAQRGFTHFDTAFTSTLQRAVRTCDRALEEATAGDTTDTKRVQAWQLNERHYGSLQGERKNDPAILEKYGKDQLTLWRRDFHAVPPSMDETHMYYQPPPAPLTESLQHCQNRVLQYWYDVILPSLVPGSNVLLVAHSNTLRVLVSHLDKVDHDKIPHIHIPNSVPCLYYLDTTGTAVSPVLDSAAGGTHGHWLFSSENHERLRDKIGGSSGSFVHAIFEAWDTNGDGVLSREEIGHGLRDLMSDDNVALGAIAAKILEEIDTDGSNTLDLREFETFAVAVFRKLVPDLIE